MDKEFKDMLLGIKDRPLKKYNEEDRKNIRLVSKMIYEQSENMNHRQALKLLRDIKKAKPQLTLAVEYVTREIHKVRVKDAKEKRAQRDLKELYRKGLFQLAIEETTLDKAYLDLVIRHLLKGITDLSDHSFVYKMLDELADRTKKKTDKEVIRHVYKRLKEIEVNKDR